MTKPTTEELDIMQFGKVLHKRPDPPLPLCSLRRRGAPQMCRWPECKADGCIGLKHEQ